MSKLRRDVYTPIDVMSYVSGQEVRMDISEIRCIKGKFFSRTRSVSSMGETYGSTGESNVDTTAADLWGAAVLFDRVFVSGANTIRRDTWNPFSVTTYRYGEDSFGMCVNLVRWDNHTRQWRTCDVHIEKGSGSDVIDVSPYKYRLAGDERCWKQAQLFGSCFSVRPRVRSCFRA